MINDFNIAEIIENLFTWAHEKKLFNLVYIIPN